MLFVCAVVLVNALVGERGLLQMRRVRHDDQRLAASISAIKQDNAALQEQARQLREDPTALERLARQELGFIRPGEIVVIVKTSPASPAPH
jgi:cell division protein FtsB